MKANTPTDCWAAGWVSTRVVWRWEGEWGRAAQSPGACRVGGPRGAQLPQHPRPEAVGLSLSQNTSWCPPARSPSCWDPETQTAGFGPTLGPGTPRPWARGVFRLKRSLSPPSQSGRVQTGGQMLGRERLGTAPRAWLPPWGACVVQTKRPRKASRGRWGPKGSPDTPVPGQRSPAHQGAQVVAGRLEVLGCDQRCDREWGRHGCKRSSFQR